MFADRIDAGNQLAKTLLSLGVEGDLVVAIPRGGVIVGKPIACKLKIPLETIITKKIGAPGFPEVAIGAIALDGSLALDQLLIKRLGISADYLKEQQKLLRRELERRAKLYCSELYKYDLEEKTVILVDDGVATGYTVKAAAISMRRHKVKKIILAVPVCAAEAAQELSNKYVDQLVCLAIPKPFYAVGLYYKSFEQNTDQQVLDALTLVKQENES
ncbi:MAG TPA: phosphoribosyltransferase [Clostridia bacterium]|nr:phosphoribosyltransferase [Clostridia bacterium]